MHSYSLQMPSLLFFPVTCYGLAFTPAGSGPLLMSPAVHSWAGACYICLPHAAVLLPAQVLGPYRWLRRCTAGLARAAVIKLLTHVAASLLQVLGPY